MTAVDVREDLVPLRTGFDLVWRGYDRDQVQHYVHTTETDLLILTADRGAAIARTEDLARQLEAANSQIDELREQIDRICRTPIDPAALTDRLRRMVELAHEEAADVTTRARTAAEHSWSVADRATERLRERAERLVTDLDRRRAEMEAEHIQLMDRAQQQVLAMTRQAEQRRRELDEQAARIREQVETDFTVAMAARRSEAMQALTEQKKAAEAHANELVRDADERARRIVADAQHEVDALYQRRDQLAGHLRAIHRLLTDAEPLLDPLDQEDHIPAGGETR